MAKDVSDIPVTTELLRGRPASAVIQEVVRAKHDLLVRSHGRDRAVLPRPVGTVDMELQRQPLPGLVDRPSWARRTMADSCGHLRPRSRRTQADHSTESNCASNYLHDSLTGARAPVNGRNSTGVRVPPVASRGGGPVDGCRPRPSPELSGRLVADQAGGHPRLPRKRAKITPGAAIGGRSPYFDTSYMLPVRILDKARRRCRGLRTPALSPNHRTP